MSSPLENRNQALCVKAGGWPQCGAEQAKPGASVVDREADTVAVCSRLFDVFEMPCLNYGQAGRRSDIARSAANRRWPAKAWLFAYINDGGRDEALIALAGIIKDRDQWRA